MKKSKVYVFTMDTCVHCTNLKKILYESDIDFTEIEITLNGDLWKKVVEQTESNVVPTVLIKPSNEDNSYIYIPGKDFETEDQILEIIKSSK